MINVCIQYVLDKPFVFIGIQWAYSEKLLPASLVTNVIPIFILYYISYASREPLRGMCLNSFQNLLCRETDVYIWSFLLDTKNF